jgi:hypothetical protein
MKRNKIEIKLNINNKTFQKNLNKIKNENFSSSSESENNNYIDKINEKIYLTQIKNEKLLNDENKKNIFDYDKNYDEIQEKKKLEMNEKKTQLKKTNLVNKILKTIEIKNLNIIKNKQKIENEKYFKEFGKKIPIFYTKNYKNKINELNNNNFFDDFSKNKEIINNRKEEYSKNLYSDFEIENFNNLLKKNNKNTENNNNNNNLSNEEEKINFYKNNYLQRKKFRNESNL